MKIYKAFILIFLCLIPTAMLILGFFMDRLPYFYDPEYVYLFNGVNLLFSQKICHIDHPGTPLQMIYAVIIKIRFHFFKEFSDFDKDIIVNAEKYIIAVNRTLLIIQSIVVLWIGITVYKLNKNIWLCILLQWSNFYFTLNSYIMATRSMTENVMMICCVLFIIMILKINKIIEEHFDNKKLFKAIILLSIITGFGVATKFLFLMLVVIPLIIIPKMYNKIVYFIGCIISGFIFTFPIRYQYFFMLRWFKTLLFHKGIYGAGELGFFEKAAMINNLKFILTSNLHILIVLIISFVCLIFVTITYIRNNEIFKRQYLLFLSVFLFSIISLIIVSKHFDPGHIHYLVIPFSMIGLLCYSIIVIFNTLYKKKYIIKFIFTPLFTILLIAYLSYDIFIMNKNSYYYYLSLRNENKIVDKIISDNPDCIQIYNYGWNFNRMTALTFEFQNSNFLHAKMMELYPNTYFFNFLFFPGNFSNWFTEVDIHKILKKNNKALIIGAPLLEINQQDFLKHNLKIEPLHEGLYPIGYNSIYFLKELDKSDFK